MKFVKAHLAVSSNVPGGCAAVVAQADVSTAEWQVFHVRELFSLSHNRSRD